MWSRAVAAILQAFAVFAFFTLGFCCILLPHLPEARVQFAHLLLNHEEQLTLIGFGFFSLSLLFFLGFYSLQRGRFFRLKMGGAEIRMRVIRKTLEECLRTHFPRKVALEGTSFLAERKLEITIRLPPLEEADRDALFVSVEKHLQSLLKEKFGYAHPFHLVVRSI